ncbi:MAG: hypothetical protein J5874_02760 [Oscillospiraceae bacterium]|nr:hypothetical protein [Oscillospiraceae bacterium]
MINIFLLGPLGDKRISNTVRKILLPYFSVAFDSFGGVVFPDSPEIQLINCGHISTIFDKKSILILKESFSSRNKLGNIGSTTAIIPEENSFALSAVKTKTSNFITCGLSSSAALGFSSFTSESAVISLQSKLTNIFGNHVFPCDISVKYSNPPERFSLLAACAALLLTVDRPVYSFTF